MSIWKSASIGATALALGFAPVQAGPAQQAAVPVLEKSAAGPGVTQVRDRRHYRGSRHRGSRGFGRGIGIGLGVGVLGAIIASEAYRPRPGYYYDDEVYDGPYYYPSGYRGDPRTVCAQNFRSFEWHTGLYTTYRGEKVLCPYLR